MDIISKALKLFVASKLQKDDIWKDLAVFYNDANVAGEGEHKLLEYIKLQRGSKILKKGQLSYNPNTRHCIFGADADLIMLALITHEPHFYIMRQNLNVQNWKFCEICEEVINNL
jgi:5'-3' exoribonuclease 2